MKKIMSLLIFPVLLYSCKSGSNESSNVNTASPDTSVKASQGSSIPYDSSRGVGRFTHVDLGNNLDEALATQGATIYGAKCAACHKLSNEKLVGPGWTGVTLRHKPEWIMNFITNTDEMLNKDPKAKAMLEVCLVRMPNQNLQDAQAREILEFMRQNDGVK